MKALVLCAGKGTRLQPLTYSMPKHILPLANVPIVFHIIKKLVNLGITEIGLIVGYMQEQIRETVGDGSQLGAKVTYIVQDKPKGLAHAVKMGQDFVGDDSFMVFLGDNIFEDDLTNLVRRYNEEKPSCIINLKEVDDPQRFGVAVLDGDRIIKVVEKPKEPLSNLALAGVYIFDKVLFQAIDELEPSWRNEYEITDAIQGLIDKDLIVKGEILHGKWLDTGKPRDIIDANRYLCSKLNGWHISGDSDLDEDSILDGTFYIGKGSKMRKCTIKGPVIIGDNCEIENATLLPNTCIGNGSEIRNVNIENSIILENSIIRNVKGKIVESIIGKNVELSALDLKGDCTLLLGSDDKILGTL
ncbi:MAG: glucose-1-phosphate thymidylyltransferase [Candidatus Cloacimonetes bacterium]|nr:glucose-1-phosphate thymidylyltransferase [Candidatus Cloacimonadota bacterium]